jgi:hypothetical protein
MKAKCSKCGALFEANGESQLIVILGGMDCLACKTEASVDLIVRRRGSDSVTLIAADQLTCEAQLQWRWKK